MYCREAGAGTVAIASPLAYPAISPQVRTITVKGLKAKMPWQFLMGLMHILKR